MWNVYVNNKSTFWKFLVKSHSSRQRISVVILVKSFSFCQVSLDSSNIVTFNILTLIYSQRVNSLQTSHDRILKSDLFTVDEYYIFISKIYSFFLKVINLRLPNNNCNRLIKLSFNISFRMDYKFHFEI